MITGQGRREGQGAAAQERRAIVLGITDDDDFAAGALLAGLKRWGLDAAVTVVVLREGPGPEARAAFRSLWPLVAFRPYDQGRMIGRLKPGGKSVRLARVLSRYSALVVAKLELPDLPAEYDRCVWLDADILVQEPFGALWEFGAMAWRPLPPGAVQRRERVLAKMGHLSGQPDLPLLNGGAVGVARALLDVPGCTSADLYALARDLLERTDTQTPDEMALYLLASSRRVPVTLWPLALNHPVQAPGVRGAAILHAIGPHKFWNATPLIHLFPDWARHQAEWVAAGGTACHGPVLLQDVHPLDPRALLRTAERRADWLALYDRLRPDLPAGLQIDPRLDGRQMILTFAGRPAEQQIRLSRPANPRRIGVDLVLGTGDQARALAALSCAVSDLRDGPPLSLPLDQIAVALWAVAGAVGR